MGEDAGQAGSQGRAATERADAVRTILASGVIAIARRVPREALRGAAEALAEAGVGALEVTMDSPGALEEIAWLRERYGERLAIGAGTVMTAADAISASEAGAVFVVSPHVDPTVIAAAHARGMASLPGAFTPTEIVAAVAAGAALVKWFPAEPSGPGFLRALRAPFPEVRLVPAGGVGPENAEAYVWAGAAAVAAGGALFGGPPGEVARRARELVEAVRRGRDERALVRDGEPPSSGGCG